MRRGEFSVLALAGKIAATAELSRNILYHFQIFTPSPVRLAFFMIALEAMIVLAAIIMPATMNVLPDDDQFVFKAAAFQ